MATMAPPLPPPAVAPPTTAPQPHHHHHHHRADFVFLDSLYCFSLSPPNVVTIIYALVMTDNKAFKKPGVVIREGPEKNSVKVNAFGA
uniref:HDC02760 n=1 Tax=Drosophila melanogaster TaxID=7227 RepID=Q6IHC6_DROME|nr:TPA_inf: HDC02760 [Drosophila melanogaster]